MVEKKKLFCVSYHKTGTSSAHQLFLQNGISSCHSPAVVDGNRYEAMVAKILSDKAGVVRVLQPVIEKYDAHFDIPWAGIYHELLDMRDDAVFLYIDRDADSWWNSLAAHWSLSVMPRVLRPYEVLQYSHVLPADKRLVRSADEALFKDCFARHREQVHRIIPADRLITLRLDDQDVAARLSDAAGLTVSGCIPHANRRKSKSFRLARNLYSLLRNAYRFGWSY
ncbi:sulfotransferase [Anderseniella sp. Alg231-50]|uniref:sulfotransferase n=1 Tax=Anderseniella sp. Alg231-50 TaxID=1922226 RepID=UPI000D560539